MREGMHLLTGRARAAEAGNVLIESSPVQDSADSRDGARAGKVSRQRVTVGQGKHLCDEVRRGANAKVDDSASDLGIKASKLLIREDSDVDIELIDSVSGLGIKRSGGGQGQRNVLLIVVIDEKREDHGDRGAMGAPRGEGPPGAASNDSGSTEPDMRLRASAR
jgi:hypothetical protein